MIRRVSGDRTRPLKLRRRSPPDGARGRSTTPRTGSAEGCSGGGASTGAAFGSTVAVSIADAIQGFDLGEIRIDCLELLAHPLDVAVDRPVIDIDVLAISGNHQLIAVF